jgi:hypothetical protein
MPDAPEDETISYPWLRASGDVAFPFPEVNFTGELPDG